MPPTTWTGIDIIEDTVSVPSADCFAIGKKLFYLASKGIKHGKRQSDEPQEKA
jgi:hypothetical protein